MKSCRRFSVPAGSSVPAREKTASIPQRSRLTTIGPAQPEPTPAARAASPTAPGNVEKSSTRAVRCVSKTCAVRLPGSGGVRAPTPRNRSAPKRSESYAAPMLTLAPSASKRSTMAPGTFKTDATSRATVEKNASDAGSRATSVATRRRADCSSASPRARSSEAASSARLSVFAIAVARSSVNAASRSSVSGGQCLASVDVTFMTPQRRPCTVTGAPTAERYPSSSARAAQGPGASAKSSMRAGRPVRSTAPVTLSGSMVASSVTESSRAVPSGRDERIVTRSAWS
jgi:hypothetical protein